MPAIVNLEKVLPVALVDVSANISIVVSATPPLGVDNAQIIRVDQPTDFTFDWTPGGWLVQMGFFTGNLKFDVFYELMGPGEAVIGAPTTSSPLVIPLGAFGVAQTYTLTIPANKVPPGVYRMVVRMGLLPPAGATTPTIICGFEEVGLVEYYDI
jgi:hypothetical protein